MLVLPSPTSSHTESRFPPQQVLYDIVQYIVSLYPPGKRDRLKKVAKSFRLPYWDWAAIPTNGSSVLPLSLGGSPNVAVSGPNGVQTIANPLFSYTFKPFNGSIFPEPPVRYPLSPITNCTSN